MPIEATPEDLELDRLAARAAGIHLHHWNENLQRWMTSSVQDGDPDGSWNAREDDGDALRLMSALDMRVSFSPTTLSPHVDVSAERYDPSNRQFFYKQGRNAATRRAITCVAAEIGRRMP